MSNECCIQHAMKVCNMLSVSGALERVQIFILAKGWKVVFFWHYHADKVRVQRKFFLSILCRL